MDKGGGGKTLIQKMWIKNMFFFLNPSLKRIIRLMNSRFSSPPLLLLFKKISPSLPPPAPPPSRSDDDKQFYKLDSSLKKNTAFIKKCKTFSDGQKAALTKEMAGLNLSKYMAEVAASLLHQTPH